MEKEGYTKKKKQKSYRDANEQNICWGTVKTQTDRSKMQARE